MTHTEDPLSDIAVHAAAVLHAGLAAGTHAATVLAQRRARNDRTRAAQDQQTATVANQRRAALERIRNLPDEHRARSTTTPTPTAGRPTFADAQARFDDQWRAVLLDAGADEDLADTIRAAPALPRLVEDCERLGIDHGRMDELATALTGALAERTFHDVRDPAAVLHHRIGGHVVGPGPVPGCGGGVPALARKPGTTRPPRVSRLPDSRPTRSLPSDRSVGR